MLALGDILGESEADRLGLKDGESEALGDWLGDIDGE